MMVVDPCANGCSKLTVDVTASVATDFFAETGRRKFVAYPAVKGIEHKVASVAEFETALTKVAPGDHIVWAAGTYDLGGLTWKAASSGTAGSEIVMRPAGSIDSVTFTNSDSMLVKGSYLDWVGFRYVDGAAIKYFLTYGDHVRFRHGDYVDTSSGYQGAAVCKVHHVFGDDFEFSDNQAKRFANFLMSMVENILPNTSHAVRGWVHHNTVDSDDVSKGPIIHVGMGGVKANGDEDLDVIFEYNRIEWDAVAAASIVNVKSAHNIVRYNYIADAGGSSGHLAVRGGDRNLIYGNWVENTRWGLRFNGTDNIAVYNYFTGALSPHAVLLFAKTAEGNAGATDNRAQLNLFRDFSNQCYTMTNGGTIVTGPKGNVIVDNFFLPTYATVDKSEGDAHPQATFLAENTVTPNALMTAAQPDTFTLPSPTITNSGAVGIAGSKDLYGDHKHICPPTWWPAVSFQ